MFRPKIECEQCNNELDYVEVDMFDHEGADDWHEVGFLDHEGGIYLDLPLNWTGHDFDDCDDEKHETIRCPYCKKYPFKCTEIQTTTFDRVVMFFGKTGEADVSESWV
jgi:hypothetical protein